MQFEGSTIHPYVFYYIHRNLEPRLISEVEINTSSNLSIFKSLKNRLWSLNLSIRASIKTEEKRISCDSYLMISAKLSVELEKKDDFCVENEIKKEVVELCSKFPIYNHLIEN